MGLWRELPAVGFAMGRVEGVFDYATAGAMRASGCFALDDTAIRGYRNDRT